MGLTDRETVEQVRENPYLQYFLGYSSFSSVARFDASTLVSFRKRLGIDCIQQMNDLFIQRAQNKGASDVSDDENGAGADAGPQSDGADNKISEGDGSVCDESGQESASTQLRGCVMIDATGAPADSTYPTDLKLLNHAREISEIIVDTLHCPYIGTHVSQKSTEGIYACHEVTTHVV